jgi:hypothetical protein
MEGSEIPSFSETNYGEFRLFFAGCAHAGMSIESESVAGDELKFGSWSCLWDFKRTDVPKQLR